MLLSGLAAVLALLAGCQPEPVIVEVTSIEVEPPGAHLKVGDTQMLTVTVYPDNATDRTVSWSSSKPTVATVDEGVVTAVSAGFADIVATSNSGGKTATCRIMVTDGSGIVQ